MLSSSRYFLTVLEATLSMMLKTGLKPLLVKYMMFPLKVAIFDSSFKSLTGVARISLDDHYYITKTSVFPSMTWLGIFRWIQHIWYRLSYLVSHVIQIGDYILLLRLVGVDLCLFRVFLMPFWLFLWYSEFLALVFSCGPYMLLGKSQGDIFGLHVLWIWDMLRMFCC